MADQRRRIRVIWNANAGSKSRVGATGTTRDAMLDLLSRHGLGSELVETATPEEATKAAREAAAGGYDVVVAAGGDGTIARVAEGLLGTESALGILPLGTIMNIPRMLGIPRDLEPAAAIVAAGTIGRIDVGEARGQVFYESGSVGMNAAMFREAQRFDDGDWSSVVRTVWTALRYRPARMQIRLDDRRIRTRALMVTVSNGPFTGAGMTVAPAARLDDGRLDVRVFRRFSKWQLIRHLLSIAFGRYRYAPQVSTYRSRRIEVSSVHPLPCRADSNDLGFTPVVFEVRPRALSVVLEAPEVEGEAAAPASTAIG
jgi:diacylglycerol kinase (ATP)